MPADGAEGGLNPGIADGAAALEFADQLVVAPLGFVVLGTGQAIFTSRSIGTGLATMSRTGQWRLTASMSSTYRSCGSEPRRVTKRRIRVKPGRMLSSMPKNPRISRRYGRRARAPRGEWPEWKTTRTTRS